VNLVINELAGIFEIDWHQGLFVACWFDARIVWRRATVTTVVHEERVTSFGVFDQPLHASDHVIFGWTFLALLIVRESEHMVGITREVVLWANESFDIRHVVETAVQLILGTDVVDANEQTLFVAGTV